MTMRLRILAPRTAPARRRIPRRHLRGGVVVVLLALMRRVLLPFYGARGAAAAGLASARQVTRHSGPRPAPLSDN